MCDVPIGSWVEFSGNGRFLQTLAAQIYNDAYIYSNAAVLYSNKSLIWEVETIVCPSCSSVS